MINYPNLFVNADTRHKIGELERLDRQVQTDSIRAIKEAQNRAEQMDIQTNLPNQMPKDQEAADQEPKAA